MEMEWVETFLKPFTIIYSVVLVCIMDFALVESRFPKRVYIGAAALCAVLLSVTGTLLYRIGGLAAMQNYSILIDMLPSGILFYFMSKHRCSRFFLAFCTADMAGMAAMMLSLYVGSLFGDNPLATLLTRIVLLTLMAVFIVKWVSKPFCQVLNTVTRGWGAAAFVAIQFYMLLYGYFLSPVTVEKRSGYVPAGLLFLLLLFSCYWFIYKTISWLSEIHLAEKTEQGLRLQLALQKEQYGAMQKKMETDQMFRHDLRHHVKLLAGMLGTKNVEEAQEYLQKLGSYSLEAGTKSYCENIVVNAVLSSQLAAAKQLGIKVTCKAVLPATVEMDEIELCVVLSNLLENAVEHCRGKDTAPPELNISIKKNKGQLCIRIENSIDGNVRQDENGAYLSEKPQGGVGLCSVAAIVEKHHGAPGITHTKNTFTVDAAL